MKLVLQRAWSDHRATMGMLSILGVSHDPIFTLENPLRPTDEDSRIPGGFYDCSPYSGTKYKDVYIIKGVPNRSAILIHWGNFEKDTLGCVLVGKAGGMMSGEPSVMSSKDAFNYLKSLVGENDFSLEVRERYE